MLKLLCSITLLHLLRVLLTTVQCQTNITNLTLNKELETTSDVVNPLLTSNVSTNGNLSDLDTTLDVMNPSPTSNISTNDVMNKSPTLNYSTSGNVSDAQFAVEPHPLLLRLHLHRRRQGRRGGSCSDEVRPSCKGLGSEEVNFEIYNSPADYDKAPELPPPLPSKPNMEYYVSRTKLDWNSARDNCWSRGMKLATILSREEQMNIEAEIRKEGLTWNDNFWIGATDLDKGVFQWVVPPIPLSYTNWDDKEPNHGAVTPEFANNEHCLELSKYHMWNDHNCGVKAFFICQTRYI